MDKERLIKLTNELYRLTQLFPKKEPLRYKMREVAVEILAKPNEKDFEVLDNFFEVAKIQNWLSPFELLAVRQEYDNLRVELKNEENAAGNPSLFKAQLLPALDFQTASESPVIKTAVQASYQQPESMRPMIERQERILEFLRENGRVQVWQIKQILPEVTKRTLRRDFEHLLNQGLIERIGERNETFYQLKV